MQFPSRLREGLGDGSLRNSYASSIGTSPFLTLPASGEGTTSRYRQQQSPKIDAEVMLLGRRAEKELRQGEIEIEARIDLHGMTQAKAYAALARFMAVQVKNRRRKLLVITGKGREGQGVLRQNLRDWLRSLPEAPSLLALRPAAPKHGGDGAFYVVLRRDKAGETDQK